VGVHRSRFELERVLDRYGATDFAFVEASASAAVQFAMDGRYVELALPLPDPNEPHFTHTASGRPRAIAAQERAYEQALREHWRGLLLAVRGKLQSVESGLSTFEDEFRNFLAPHLDEKRTKRERKKPRAVNWLLGGSHSLAIALVAAFLVPASAVGAFALPPTVVGRLAAPFRGALPNELGVPSDDARALALGQSIWVRDDVPAAQLARQSRSAHRGFAATLPQADEPALASTNEIATGELGGLRYGSEPPASAPAPSSSPPSPGPDKPAPQASAPDPPSAPDEPTTPSEPGPPAENEEVPADETGSAPEPSQAEGSEGTELTAPADEPPADDGTEPPASEPEDPDDGSPAADPPTPPAPPADPGKDKDKDKGDGHDNGNHNGADNGNGNGNGNGKGNGNGNGKAKGH
jgi:hypothetical protein